MKRASLLPEPERKDALLPAFSSDRRSNSESELEKIYQNEKKVVAYFEKMYIIIFVPVWETSWLRHLTGSAGIAQSVEHFTRNEGVVGSSPISGLSKNTTIHENE